MPRVPTYDNFQANANTINATPVRAPEMPDIAGQQAQQTGQTFLRAGDALGRIALDAQEQANQVRVNDAMNQAIATRLKLTHDKDIGYTSLQGKAALERPDGKPLDVEYGDKLKDSISAITQSLGNDAQKRAFSMQAAQLQTQFTGELQAHIARESQQFALSTQAGTAKLGQDQMALNPYNIEAIAQGQNAIKAAVAEAGRLQGLSPAETLAKTVEALSPAHASVISTALQDNRIDYAKSYFEKVSAELTPQARIQLGEALKIGGTRVKVQSFGDEIMAKGMDLSSALAEARSRFQGEEEDQAVREIKGRFADVEAAKALNVKNVTNSAWSAVMETGKIPDNLIANLRATAPEEERQIKDWLDAKKRRELADAQGRFSTDMNVYYGLRRMSMDNPTAFAELDLRKSAPYLSESDFKHMIEVQGGINKSEAKAMESQRVLKQTLTAIKADVAAIGIDLTPKEGTNAAKETAKFMGTLTQALDDATKNKGAPLTEDEARRIGLGMVREGIKQNSGVFGMFQTKKKGYEIASDTTDSTSNYVVKRFNDIPVPIRDALVNEYRQKTGLSLRELTDAQKAEIERAYTRGIDSGRIR